jgi:ATP-dependent Zn protease
MWTLAGFIIYALVKLDHSEMKTSSKPQNSITFENIIGLEDSKQSLREIIHFMKDP